MDNMVKVWNIKTKRWEYVPAHWVDHPRLGKDFRKDKPKGAAESASTDATATEVAVKKGGRNA